MHGERAQGDSLDVKSSLPSAQSRPTESDSLLLSLLEPLPGAKDVCSLRLLLVCSSSLSTRLAIVANDVTHSRLADAAAAAVDAHEVQRQLDRRCERASRATASVRRWQVVDEHEAQGRKRRETH